MSTTSPSGKPARRLANRSVVVALAVVLMASASALVVWRGGPQGDVPPDALSSSQSVSSTVGNSSSVAAGFEDLQPADDLSYTLATVHSILTVEEVGGEKGEPLQLLPDEPYVKLNVAVRVSDVQFINEERLVQWKQRFKVTTGEIYLELGASSIEQGRTMLGALQQLKPPFYVGIMGVPPLRNNPDGGLEIRAVYQVNSGSVRFTLPSPGLSEDLAGVARILKRPASAELIADWATEMNATAMSGSAGPIARAYQQVAQAKVGAPPSWEQVDPGQRAFNDTLTPPPPAIAAQLQDFSLTVLVPASSAASPGRNAVAIRSKTANVHLALLSAGSHNTPVKILPGEPIEVWILPDGPDTIEGHLVAEIDVATLQRNGGVTLRLIPVGDGKWTAQVEPCSDSAQDCSRAAIAAAQTAGD